MKTLSSGVKPSKNQCNFELSRIVNYPDQFTSPNFLLTSNFLNISSSQRTFWIKFQYIQLTNLSVLTFY